MLWVSFVALVFATIVDVRTREIPNAIPALLLGCAVVATAFGVASHGWTALGLGLGLGFLAGAVLFSLGGFGGGDAKLLAALGAALGPRSFLSFLFYVAISGGLLAAIALLRGKRDIAYTPAMALGMGLFMIVRGLR